MSQQEGLNGLMDMDWGFAQVSVLVTFLVDFTTVAGREGVWTSIPGRRTGSSLLHKIQPPNESLQGIIKLSTTVYQLVKLFHTFKVPKTLLSS